MRHFLLFLLLVLVAAGIYGFGEHLPRTHVVSRKAFFHRSMAEVWKATNGVNAWVDLIDTSAVEPLPARADHKGWRLTGEQDQDFEIAVIEEKAPGHQVTRVTRSRHPTVLTRILDMNPDGEGTIVTLTQESETKSVFWRMILTLGRADDRMTARTVGDWQKNLNEPAEKP